MKSVYGVVNGERESVVMSLKKVYEAYFKIGTFTLGGGYAMLPLIQREIVERKHWISEEEFVNMIALAQAAPGLIAVNSAIFIGWRCGGWKGVLGAVLGAVLPSFVIILTIAMIFSEWKNYPAVEAIFKGIRPAVVALIVAPLVGMAKREIVSKKAAKNREPQTINNAWFLLVSLVAALLIWLVGVNPVWVILATIILTLIVLRIKSKICNLNSKI